MTDTLTVNLVSKADGSIDQEASEQAFADQLAAHIVDRETQDTQIANVVSSLFDKHLGKFLTMPTLCSLAVGALNGQPENWKTLSERVANYVRANSQERKAADGTITKDDSSAYVIGRGAGKGVARRADQPVKA